MTARESEHRRRRVALFQPNLPHYRVDLLNELDRVIGNGLVLFAPPTLTGLDGSIERSLVTRRRAKTWRMGPVWFVPETFRAVWQRDWDAVILSWNVRQVELFPAMVLGRLRGVPIILWGHGLGATRSGPAFTLRHLQARLAAAVLTYDDVGRQEVMALAPGQDVRVLQNTTGRSAPDVEQHLVEPRRRIAYLGRVVRRKHVDRLLRALAQLSDDGLDLHLDVVGDGSERTSLSLEADRLGLSGRIRWHGYLHDWTTTRRILADTDLVVLPSHAGLAVVDAFAAARAVMVVDDPAMNPPEAALVVERESGFRYSPATADALADRLAQIYADPDCLIHASRGAATTFRERLTLEHVGAEFESLITDIADAP